MKRIGCIILSVMLAICMLFTTSCSLLTPVTVTNSYINDESHMIIEFSDGTTQDLGEISGIEGGSKYVISRTYVNDEKHIIVEYADGNTEDLGYVGVELAIYTVTFVDINGNVLSVQQVSEGKSATAPNPPKIAGEDFAGWDQNFSSVHSDMTVRPLYGSGITYNVVFLDENGEVIKTEMVVAGRSAKEPDPPARENTIFDRWDTDFSSVNSDLTIQAIYREKRMCTVTFVSYDGAVLKSETVKEGSSVQAPDAPQRDGYLFTGWSPSPNVITSDVTISPQYSYLGDPNEINVYTSVSGNTVTVDLYVEGNVLFCAMEGSMSIPSGLTYSSHVDGSGAMANYSGGELFFMFSSNSGRNVTSSTMIFSATFTFDDTFTSGTFGVDIADIYDETMESVSYSVSGGSVSVG